ncbi:MAG: acylphosphatase, partial [Planctomycetia bacterium]
MIRRRLHITGTVQGVGFRPFVWRLAHRLGLVGWVENVADGVAVEVEGAAEAVAGFIAGVRDEAPPLAAVDEVVVTEVAEVTVPPQPCFVIEPTRPSDRATAAD